MKIPTITDSSLALTWETVDTAYANQAPKLQYCADGDGFVVVRETTKGYKLFDQGDFVRIVGDDLIDALKQAEDYMMTNGYAHMITRAVTSDGYTFTLQDDGTWSDGDMTFPDAHALRDAVENEIQFFRQ
jgi:hypothetical protein